MKVEKVLIPLAVIIFAAGLIFWKMKSQNPATLFLANEAISVVPADENILLEVSADKNSAAKEEAIELTYHLLTRYDSHYEGLETEPRFPGFWIERLDITDKTGSEMVELNGKRYMSVPVYKLRLYPLKAGELVIKPGSANVRIKDEGGVFKRMFVGSRPITITVKETGLESKFVPGFSLPENIPSTAGVPQIILLMDVSGSMIARDLSPDRISAARKAAQDFLDSKPNAAIGIKAYAKKVETVAPLSGQNPGSALQKVAVGMMADGTALGDAMLDAVKEFKPAPGLRAIVILTDGDPDNAGNLEPVTAAEFGKKRGVSVFVVHIGKKGLVPFPVNDPLFGRRNISVEIKPDEEILKEIAFTTGGQYFKAENETQIQEAFAAIRRKLKV